MQLYSSVLNSEQIKQEETSNKKFAIPKALSDLKTTLRENIDKKREALKRTFSEDFEADAPESLHETVILEKRLSPGSVGSNPVWSLGFLKGSIGFIVRIWLTNLGLEWF